jgi:hypothetical protein
MKYVDMNDVAFDPNAIAFPGLGNCHGIVYHTSAGLFAYHAGGNALDSAGKAEAFGMFVSNHLLGSSAHGICLYGACPTNRHSSATAHKTELKMIAKALKFDGPIKGHRWDLGTLGWGTTYVEFLCNAGAVTVSIEDFTSQPVVSGANGDAFGHKFVLQRKDPTTTGQGQFASCKCTPKNDVIIGVTRKATTPTVVTPATL